MPLTTPLTRPGLLRRGLVLLTLLAGLGIGAVPAPAAAGPSLIPLAVVTDTAAAAGPLEQVQYRRPYRRYYRRPYARPHYRPYYRPHRFYQPPRRHYRRY
ncbi:MAG TPA: hypothetical protein VGM87_03585 [Roseomonas sp.]|jgi:hypothetical protein